MKAKVLSLLLSICCLPSGNTQSTERTSEQQQLSIFQGRWTIEGSETTYLEVCDWIQGNHIQCLSKSHENEVVDSAVSYLTYSALEKTYVYYGLYSSGSSRTLRGNWETDRFILEGQRITEEKKTKWKVTIIPVHRDIHFIQEVSVNDGPFEVNADFMYKRLE